MGGWGHVFSFPELSFRSSFILISGLNIIQTLSLSLSLSIYIYIYIYIIYIYSRSSMFPKLCMFPELYVPKALYIPEFFAPEAPYVTGALC